jgi:hypothetical protein
MNIATASVGGRSSRTDTCSTTRATRSASSPSLNGYRPSTAAAPGLPFQWRWTHPRMTSPARSASGCEEAPKGKLCSRTGLHSSRATKERRCFSIQPARSRQKPLQPPTVLVAAAAEHGLVRSSPKPQSKKTLRRLEATARQAPELAAFSSGTVEGRRPPCSHG